MVAVKLAILGFFCVVAFTAFNGSHFHNFAPNGFGGIVDGAALIFFAYIGFDAVSTGSEETKNPRRDLPIGIIGALLISAVLYVAMSSVLTGMVPYPKLDSDAPVAVALDMHPQLSWLSPLLKIGVIAGMTSVILTSLLGQPRILLSMADDGLLPPFMSRCHPRFKTPHVSTVITGLFAALIAAVFPLDLLTDLISMGILLAFAVVCAGVLVLRYTRPDEPRPFRVPWAPVTCVLGTVVCLGMTYFLSGATWMRLVIWTALGMSIYAFYGFRHSRLRQ
jgi:APA family basic amino acid/polyamine antiporter